ncbi:MAG: hypothetical protein JNJ90_02105 [Saprospiraceae bacterium]|nr:hypothetical protein [Saprospiraceae bacterium]
MGEIITFYAYKGGTGRTMALANTAVLLSRKNEGRVLMIDWDLEAPGLEQYFKPFAPGLETQKGILDFVIEAEGTLRKMPFGEEDEAALEAFFSKIEALAIPISIPGSRDNLFLVRAGFRDDTYGQRISQFDWGKFYQQIPGFFPRLAKFLADRFEYVLIDSRTGHTDVGGICTMSMPEKLVLVFTPNQQSLSGVLELARKAAEYRMNYGDLRPLAIYPLPARVDFSGVSISKRLHWEGRYIAEWEQTFQEIYALPPTISLKNYFESIYIRHDSNFAFGEDLAVLPELPSGESIAQDYNRLVRRLSLEKIWENQPFANIASPFEVSFVFAKADKPPVERMKRELGWLRSQNVVFWDDKQVLPVEEWDETIQKRIASGTPELVVVFLSNHLFAAQSDYTKQKSDWETWVSESIHSKTSRIVTISLEKNEVNGVISSQPMLPTRSKPLSEWEDKDEAWTRIMKHFEREVIKVNEQKHHSYGKTTAT